MALNSLYCSVVQSLELTSKPLLSVYLDYHPAPTPWQGLYQTENTHLTKNLAFKFTDSDIVRSWNFSDIEGFYISTSCEGRKGAVGKEGIPVSTECKIRELFWVQSKLRTGINQQER